MHLLIEVIDPTASSYYSEKAGVNHGNDSGFDLYVLEDTVVKANETKLVGLGIKVAAYGSFVPTNGSSDENTNVCNNSKAATSSSKLPELPSSSKLPSVQATGYYLPWLVFPRSSICKTPLRLANSIGLIDSGYRGEIKLALDNIRDKDYTIKKGDRIAQAVAFDGSPITCSFTSCLDTTARGEGGFGSTGANGVNKNVTVLSAVTS